MDYGHMIMIVLLWHLDYMSLTSFAPLCMHLVSLAQLYICHLILSSSILSQDLDTHYFTMWYWYPMPDLIILVTELRPFQLKILFSNIFNFSDIIPHDLPFCDHIYISTFFLLWSYDSLLYSWYYYRYHLVIMLHCLTYRILISFLYKLHST